MPIPPGTDTAKSSMGGGGGGVRLLNGIAQCELPIWVFPGKGEPRSGVWENRDGGHSISLEM